MIPRRKFLNSAGATALVAVLAAGSVGYEHSLALAAPVQTVDSAQPAPGFADLVAKVKPAVVSVRVKMDGRGSQPHEDTMICDQQG